MSWWTRNVDEPGKLPLVVLFCAFVVTFLVTRLITRLIRAGRGPFHDLSAGGVHLHHSTPGILLLTTGAVVAVAADGRSPAQYIAAAVVGVGASLVFDEFAMILHLDDVYWEEEGRQSVQAVGLVTACLALAIIGFAPFGVEDVGATELGVRVSGLGIVSTTLIAAVVCSWKGKYRVALLVLFLPPVGYVCAVRLARPGSRWDRRFYRSDPERRHRATLRAESFDRRWNRRWRWLGDLIAGAPDAST